MTTKTKFNQDHSHLSTDNIEPDLSRDSSFTDNLEMNATVSKTSLDPNKRKAGDAEVLDKFVQIFKSQRSYMSIYSIG